MIVVVRTMGRGSSPHGGRRSTVAGVSRAAPVPSHMVGFHLSVHYGRGDSSASVPPGPAFAGRIRHTSSGSRIR